MNNRSETAAGGGQINTRRSDYSLVVKIATRWNDYDMLGHINNVEYYRYFESIVLTLLSRVGLNWTGDQIIPFTVENHCCFRRPLMPVNAMDGCIRIARVGRSSVTYELALFMPDDKTPSAYGYFVHVFVDRNTERSAEIPEGIRASFEDHQNRLNRRNPDYVAASSLFPANIRVLQMET